MMAQMLILRKEMLRINLKDAKKLEYSTNDGRSWLTRFSGSPSIGEFKELNDNGRELLATTDRGLFYSTNDGRSWLMRSR
jgi:hypothetical protein